MNKLLHSLAFGILYLTTHTVLAAEPSGRVAMVVGIGDYPDAPLNNAVSDAQAVREMLTGQLGFAASDVKYCENPDRLTLLECFEQFKEDASNAEIVLFYYAGHGMENIDGDENYLIPVDAAVEQAVQSEAALKNYGVNLMELSNEMKDASIGAKIWLLDCCRERPLSRSIAAESGGLVQYEDGRIPADTLMMLAASPRRLASDGLERGPFTEALLEVLPSQEVDLLNAFYAVSDHVKATTRGLQIPWMKLDGSGQIFRQKGFLASGSPAIKPNTIGNYSTGPSAALPGANNVEVASKVNPPTSPPLTAREAMLAKQVKDRQQRALSKAVASPPAAVTVGGQATDPPEPKMPEDLIVLNKLSDQPKSTWIRDMPAAQPNAVVAQQPSPPVVYQNPPQPSNPSPVKSHQPVYNLDDDFDYDYDQSYEDKPAQRAFGRAALSLLRSRLPF